MNVELLKAQATTCGRYFVGKDLDVPPQVHCHYKIYFMVDGCLEYEDDLSKILLKPGCLYIMPYRKMYSIRTPEINSDKKSDVIVYFAYCQPNLCDTIVEFVVEDHIMLKQYVPFFIAIADDCGVGEGENTYSGLMHDSVSIILNLMHIIKPFNISHTNEIDDVLSYIDENLDKDLSNIHLAKIAMSSKTTFIKNFTDQVKKTPQKYVLDMRMTYALKLINEKHKMEDICDKIGYENVSAFSRAFKKLFGRSPTDCTTNLYYRK